MCSSYPEGIGGDKDYHASRNRIDAQCGDMIHSAARISRLRHHRLRAVVLITRFVVSLSVLLSGSVLASGDSADLAQLELTVASSAANIRQIFDMLHYLAFEQKQPNRAQ